MKEYIQANDHLYAHLRDAEKGLAKKETLRLISESTQEKNLTFAHLKVEIKSLLLKAILLITKEDTIMRNLISEKYVVEHL